mmetsp:Transcript_5361/g.16401  ORF Transcript_5361/g.16401 Transcript_5361/m.16401 type:complete len:287 (-) Transcript_5361:148-1008(-)
MRLCAVISQASFTLALLEEAERITELFYELSRYSERWRFLLGEDAYQQQNIVVGSVQYLIGLLHEPKLMRNAVKPASKQEEELANASHSRRDASRSGSTSGSDSSSNSSSSSSSSSRSGQREESFAAQSMRSVYRVLRNGISMVRLMSAGVWEEEQLRDPDSKLLILAPTRQLRSRPGAPPSLGMFLSCLSMNNFELKRADINAADRRLFHYLQENVLHIMLGQIQLFLTTASPAACAQLRDDIGSELDATIGRLVRIAPEHKFYALASKFLKRLLADLAPQGVAF